MGLQDAGVVLCVLAAAYVVWRRWRPKPRTRVTVVPLARVRRRGPAAPRVDGAP
jgi:hypothetical protein